MEIRFYIDDLTEGKIAELMGKYKYNTKKQLIEYLINEAYKEFILKDEKKSD